MKTATHLHRKGGGTVYRFILIFALLSLGVVAGGIIYSRQYRRNYRAEVERQLSAVAELKIGGLVDWREERLADASVFHKNAAFSALVRRFFKNPADADSQRLLQDWIGRCQASYQYARVFLLDTQGAVRLSAPESAEPASAHLLQDASESLRSGQVAFLDLHRSAPDRPIHLTILVPIFDEQDGRRPLGILALRIDPATYLYPFISRWPTPSRTAEALLVRREGDKAVFLNELKFRTNTALNLRIPLESKDVPAAKAVLGQEGIVEGIDYRGVPVIADVRRVPDSPWFLVSRMDISEVFAPLRRGQWFIIMVVVILLFSAAAGVALIWRQQSVRFYQERYEAVEALRESKTRFKQLSESSLLGIFIHQDGLFRYVNPKLAEIFGRTVEEMVDKLGPKDLTVSEDWPAVEEGIRRRLSGDVENVQAEFRAPHRDGRVLWVETRGARITYDGRPAIMGTLIDITERRTSEAEVRRLLDQSDKDRLALLGILEDEKRAEEKLIEQMTELRRWQAVMLDREDRVIALKKELNELAVKLGEKPKYGQEMNTE
ncbi:MAG: PAS domain S-box protein [Kiritimatiellae bacterium]|nr:PAS domain S-box protein [Kiritimatiellia bacterium]